MSQSLVAAYVYVQHIQGKKYPIEIGFSDINHPSSKRSLVVLPNVQPTQQDSYLNTVHGLKSNFLFKTGNVNLNNLVLKMQQSLKPSDVLIIENNDLQEAFFKSTLPNTQVIRTQFRVTDEWLENTPVTMHFHESLQKSLHKHIHINKVYCAERVAWLIANFFQQNPTILSMEISKGITHHKDEMMEVD